MWLESEIEKMRRVTAHDSTLEDFLDNDEIETIKGYLTDGKWSNEVRYNNLRNDVFVPKNFSRKVK